MNLKIFHLNTKKKYQITNILEEDAIDQVLDELEIFRIMKKLNYDFEQEDMNDKKRKSYLTKTLKKG